MSQRSRREFFRTTIRGLTATSLVHSLRAGTAEIPRRPLGRTGETVSALTLGGAHIGYDQTPEEEAIRIMHAAIDGGITFFDNSWDYNGGRSEERMGKALAMDGKRSKVFLMTKVCCHRQGWSKKAALEMLEQSLRRLQTDHLDLWQIHEVVEPDHPSKAFMADSATEALLEAKESGKVRFVGFTGHRDPKIHMDMLSRDFPFDTVQMPLNVLDAHFRSFEKEVLPVARAKGMGIIGMKPLGGGSRRGAIPETGTVTGEECLRYALSLPVSTVCTGLPTMEALDQALRVGQGFRQLEAGEISELLGRTRQIALDGRHESYKTG